MPVNVGGRQPKAILASLLLARGMVVSEDRIIEAVWNGRPPPSARQALHTYIRHLRRALEPDRAPRAHATVLLRHASGYSLALDAESIDAERFTALALAGAAALAAGQAEFAARQLDSALRLWRGAAYADLSSAALVHSAIQHLEGLRAVARENRIAAGLMLGEHHRLLAETRSLVDDYPLHEHAWELWALTLHRCGRRTEALEALRTIRIGLREELGVEPGPNLRALHAAMVAQDPALDWSPPPGVRILTPLEYRLDRHFLRRPMS